MIHFKSPQSYESGGIIDRCDEAMRDGEECSRSTGEVSLSDSTDASIDTSGNSSRVPRPFCTGRVGAAYRPAGVSDTRMKVP